MPKKAYVLLYDKHSNSIWLPIKSDNSDFMPGAPTLFGGTRDNFQKADSNKYEFIDEADEYEFHIIGKQESYHYNKQFGEKSKQTIVRELKEESGHQIHINSPESLKFMYSDQDYTFYWTDDFKGDITNFRPTAEIKDVLSINTSFLTECATNRSKLGNGLLELIGLTHANSRKKFLQSNVLSGIYYWVTKIYKDFCYT